MMSDDRADGSTRRWRWCLAAALDPLAQAIALLRIQTRQLVLDSLVAQLLAIQQDILQIDAELTGQGVDSLLFFLLQAELLGDDRRNPNNSAWRYWTILTDRPNKKRSKTGLIPDPFRPRVRPRPDLHSRSLSVVFPVRLPHCNRQIASATPSYAILNSLVSSMSCFNHWRYGVPPVPRGSCTCR